MAVPYDLAITCSHKKSQFLSLTGKEMHEKLFAEAVEYGYKHIGIEYAGEIIQVTSKKNKQIKQLIVPEILNHNFGSTAENKDQNEKKVTSVYNRVTLPMPDSSFIHTLNHGNTQKFDLVAVDLSEADDKLFNQACAELQLDIIVIDVKKEKVIGGKKVPSLKMALKRGVCLEVKYAAAILNTDLLNNFLSLLASINKHKLVSMLIVSSGASTASQIRSPEGVRDLIMASGLSKISALAFLSTNCAKAIKHGIARKSGVMGAIFSWTIDMPERSHSQDEKTKHLKRKSSEDFESTQTLKMVKT